MFQLILFRYYESNLTINKQDLVTKDKIYQLNNLYITNDYH